MRKKSTFGRAIACCIVVEIAICRCFRSRWISGGRYLSSVVGWGMVVFVDSVIRVACGGGGIGVE